MEQLTEMLAALLHAAERLLPWGGNGPRPCGRPRRFPTAGRNLSRAPDTPPNNPAQPHRAPRKTPAKLAREASPELAAQWRRSLISVT
jgi:hypothetical protein